LCGFSFRDKILICYLLLTASGTKLKPSASAARRIAAGLQN
jgi:hypothetical protein